MPRKKSESHIIFEEFICERGEPWDRWKAGWLDAAEGWGDEDASWGDHVLNTEPNVGLTPAQVRRRTNEAGQGSL